MTSTELPTSNNLNFNEFITISNNVVYDEYMHDNAMFYGRYFRYFNYLQHIEKQDTPLTKLLNCLGKPIMQELEPEANAECPITYEEIKENDIYFQCSSCKYNFSEKAIIKSLKQKLSCPMCRAKWNNFDRYKNYSVKKMLTDLMPSIDMISNKQYMNLYVKPNPFNKSTKFNKKWNYGK